jgi:gamma-glutamylcyclotransferase (GGCT)/AIG2-like uncharacterized protein YtfP
MVRGNTISYGTGVLPDRDYPADPYPGAFPDRSFVHLDELSRPVRPDRATPAGWRVDGPGPDGADARPGSGAGCEGADLDDWLAAHGAAPLAARIPLLAYGSNRCPSKITWMRRNLGLTGPVVLLRAATRDVAAVWAAGLRKRDGQRPAVLAAAPGATEEHAVWMATADQIEVLDRCEGRDDRYRLARLPGTVRTEDGGLTERPWCYLALGPIRQPLLVDGGPGGPGDSGAGVGTPVRCADVAQADARHLVGRPATDDGLDADTVRGTPHPDQWPAALFGYGLLQPWRDGWPLVAPYAAGAPRPATAHGAVYDTGLGWPAMLVDGLPFSGSLVRGTVIPLRDPQALLPMLDEYEGEDYRRVRLTLTDGTVAWAYLWIGDRTILRAV